MNNLSEIYKDEYQEDLKKIKWKKKMFFFFLSLGVTLIILVVMTVLFIVGIKYL